MTFESKHHFYILYYKKFFRIQTCVSYSMFLLKDLVEKEFPKDDVFCFTPLNYILLIDEIKKHNMIKCLKNQFGCLGILK